MGAEQSETFDTGGRAVGWIGLVASLGLVVIWFTQLADPLPLGVLSGGVLFALLFWSAYIRPRVSASQDVLELRNMFTTIRIPLAAVEEQVVRQVLAVRAGDRRYVGTGVGRSLKGAAFGGKSERSAIRGGGVAQVVVAADFVESRISDLAAQARERARVERYSDEQVALGAGITRTTAWVVIGPLVLALAGFVGSVWF